MAPQDADRRPLQRQLPDPRSRLDEGGLPPREWLDVLFNGADPAQGMGLYYMPPPGEAVTADEHVLRFSPLLSQGEAVVMGLRAWFFGFEFVLLMGRLPAGVPTAFDGASFRPAGLRALGSNSRVQFDWKGGAKSPDVTVLPVRA